MTLCQCTECQHQRERMLGIINASVSDLCGQPLTQELVNEAHRRVRARLVIMPQLLERAL